MNKKGSALMWAIVVCLIIGILTFAASSIALSYHKRSVNNIEKNQAYLTARSAVNVVSNEIISKTETGLDMLAYLGLIENNTLFIPEFNFKENMGTCNLSATLINPVLIKLTATAKVDEQMEVVSAYLNRSILPPLDEVFPKLNTPDDYTWRNWPTPASGLTPLQYNGSLAEPETTIIGNEDAKDSFYYIGVKKEKRVIDGKEVEVIVEESDFKDNGYDNQKLKPQGTGNIYIFVKKDMDFHIGQILYSDDMDKVGSSERGNKPNVFIVLEEGARLYLSTGVNIGSPLNYVYIYSQYEDSLNIGKEVGGNGEDIVRIVGSVMQKIGSSNSDNSWKVEGTYIKPVNLTYIGPDYATNLSQGKWEVVNYENK